MRTTGRSSTRTYPRPTVRKTHAHTHACTHKDTGKQHIFTGVNPARHLPQCRGIWQTFKRLQKLCTHVNEKLTQIFIIVFGNLFIFYGFLNLSLVITRSSWEACACAGELVQTPDKTHVLRRSHPLDAKEAECGAAVSHTQWSRQCKTGLILYSDPMAAIWKLLTAK